ncbi:MAG: PD-(D/E)XK nuclease family protein [Candidatus Omnitrophica bacterium]|jgi:hypothetical protein|nr:PD-(D/E)XK nuclease family protein [Candidatus Omnitrophota bacterium]
MSINLRSDVNFITDAFKQEMNEMRSSERGAYARTQNIAWPSEAGCSLGKISVGECTRKMYYRISGVAPTEPMSITGKNVCDAGNLYEDYLINKFKKYGMYKDSQIKLDFLIPDSKHKVQVNGRMDLLIEHNKQRSVIEIKSVSEFKAAKIMNSEIPLPSSSNLMQAMLYKYYTTSTEAGKALNVDNVYLMYVNRSMGSTFYYKVCIDDSGYAILTSYDLAGRELGTVNLKDVKSFEDLERTPGVSESDEARLAELKINIKDIFDKFDKIYDYARSNTLPKCDYNMIYTQAQAEYEHNIGRLSKMKLNKVKKGEVVGDTKCQYCDFRTKCMQDNGISFK